MFTSSSPSNEITQSFLYNPREIILQDQVNILSANAKAKHNDGNQCQCGGEKLEYIWSKDESLDCFKRYTYDIASGKFWENKEKPMVIQSNVP